MWLSTILKAMLLALLTLLVVSASAAAWRAGQRDGLVVAPFSTPADLAAQGMTGEVAANELRDRLVRMYATSGGGRPADSFARDWTDSIAVEQPASPPGAWLRPLTARLGRSEPVAGHVVRGSAGIIVSVRTGDDPARRYAGTDAQLDSLLDRAAEDVLRRYQPYRYGVWLVRQGRISEAGRIFDGLARSGPEPERTWALAQAGLIAARYEGAGPAAPALRQALRTNTGNIIALEALAQVHRRMGRTEAALNATQRQAAVLRGPRSRLDPAERRLAALRAEAARAELTGDYRNAARLLDELQHAAREPTPGDPRTRRSLVLSSLHQRSAAEAAWREDARWSHANPPLDAAERLIAEATAAADAQDWTKVIVLLQPLGELASASPAAAETERVSGRPLRAIALAELGFVEEAQALIANTPQDCEACLRARGRIAATVGDQAAANRWFADSVSLAPTSPHPHLDRGRMLMAAGEVDGAIVEFRRAHRKAPEFADPLTLWGEGLLRKGDYREAAGKFRQASLKAPRYGRNRLYWGEALAGMGALEAAKAQWNEALSMDLTSGERTLVTSNLEKAP